MLLVAVGTGAPSPGVAAAAAPNIVPGGFDLFETDPEQTVFRFQGQTQIPPNFFAPGSQGFQGDVEFGGVPIIKFQGKPTGDADTVVQRKEDANVPATPSNSGPVPIELVQLSLVGMAPIAVKVGSQTQLWDVRAKLSPSRPSTGTMSIQRSSDGGGTFDSQLRVYPRFTFTRLSDGATKVLDVGALPDGQRPDEPLVATGTPWRFGCIPPAFVSTLNPAFCANQTPAGKQKLAIEQSPRARHGVLPAQPLLEHFECYTVPQSNLGTVGVQLKDQFGSRDAKVKRGGGGELCNPVRKNKEPKVRNTHDHLRCYLTDSAAAVDRTVLLRNQFGPFSGRVLAPTTLCVPSTKQEVPTGPPPQPAKQSFAIDHFQCYKLQANGNYAARTLDLRDQFGTRTVTVKAPSRLCAPVAKNGKAIKHRVRHLVCYKPTPQAKVSKRVSVHNQFGGELYKTVAVGRVCVPTLKLPLPQGP